MKVLSLTLLSSLILFSCSNKVQDKVYTVITTVEITQQIGESMAALDEVGGNTSGDISKTAAQFEKSFARLAPDEKVKKNLLLYKFIPEAFAGTCTAVDFGACNATTFQKVRNISGCTTSAGGTISGAVSLTFSGTGNATCTMPLIGDGVVRTSNIGINGLRGAIFGVQNLYLTGQEVSRTGVATYTFNDTGTSRKFTAPNSSVLLNLTSSTPTPLAISGASRNARTLTAGSLRVLNNLNAVSCDFTPTGVTWTSGCNCPTAGSFAATCSDATALTVDFTSTCGTVTLTKGASDTSTVVLDRCE